MRSGVLLVLLGCSHELEGYALPPAPALALEPARRVMVVGEEVELVLHEGEGDPVEGSVAWTSTHPALAVDDGVVTASSPAAGTIRATIMGVRSEAPVIAVPHPIEGLALSPASLALALGESGRLAAIADLAAPAGEPDRADVTVATAWSTNPPDVVEVTDGTVRRIGAGDATITATAGDFTATVVVTEVP